MTSLPRKWKGIEEIRGVNKKMDLTTDVGRRQIKVKVDVRMHGENKIMKIHYSLLRGELALGAVLGVRGDALRFARTGLKTVVYVIWAPYPLR
jgi:hypothetical protein